MIYTRSTKKRWQWIPTIITELYCFSSPTIFKGERTHFSDLFLVKKILHTIFLDAKLKNLTRKVKKSKPNRGKILKEKQVNR